MAEGDLVTPAATRKGVVRSIVAKYPAMAAGLVCLAALVVIAFAVPYTSLDPTTLRVGNRLAPPTGDHLFGTDELGRDVLSRVLHGTRITLAVVFFVTLISMTIGSFVGLTAGYFGGLWESLLMRLVEAMLAVPAVILAIAFVAVFGPGVPNVIAAISIVYIPRFARLARAAVLRERQREYVEAARSLGVSDGRIIFRHLLPNAVAPLLVQATVTAAYAVQYEAILSFLGVGIPLATPTWGGIIARGMQYIWQAPWLTIIPGLIIGITVISINMIGDGLRDLFDPRME